VIRRIAYSVVVVALSCATAYAQSTLGTILGTVFDASGAVVAGATVKVTDTDEGTSRTFQTDSKGNYEAVDAKPDHYSVEVSKDGFSTQVLPGLQLIARQTLRVDATLQVGARSQQVSVVADAGVITTETMTVSSSYNSRMILELPGNYRANGSTSPYALIQALPGIQPDDSGNLSIQGGIPSQSQFSVDGISTTDVTGNQPRQSAFPSAESIAEIKVQNAGAPAEYGTPGDVTTISKSGTNQIHGAAFWYSQNAALDALEFGQLTKNSKIANDFGFNFGGPVVIPHLYNGHDKTFFFGTYEGFRFPQTDTIQNTVPTQAMVSGDFNAEGVTVINPQTGQPFLNNTIPSGSISPIAQKIISQFYPLPNVGPGTTVQNNNYVANRPANISSNQFDIRGDQYINPKMQAFARFTYKNATQLSPNNLLVPSSDNYEDDRLFVVSFSYTFKPNLLNEFRFGYTTVSFGNSNSFDGKAFWQTLGFQGLASTDPFFNGLPEIDIAGLTGLTADRLNGANQSRTRQFNDNLSWLKGRHTMKFGLDIRTILGYSPLGFIGGDNYGNFEFNNTFSGASFGDFLLGLPAFTGYDNVTHDNYGVSTQYAFYAQDSFRLNPRLTLEYGLRYEYDPAYTDEFGNIGNFDPKPPLSGSTVYPNGWASDLAPAFLNSFDACPNPALSYTANNPTMINGAPCTPVETASQAGLPQGLRTTDKTRFMPRFGFAYKPFQNDRTAVRGGIGVYNIMSMGSIYYALTGTLQSATYTFSNVSSTGTPVFTWPVVGYGSGIGAPQYGTDYFGTANDIYWKQPLSTQWNLSVDHDLGYQTGLRVSYIGMKTTQLVWAPNLNQSNYSTTFYVQQPLSSRPYPNWGTVNDRAIGATANYESLAIEATHRFSHGMMFDSTYTYGRNLADNQGPNPSSYAGENAGGRTMNYFSRADEYGNVYADRRHRWITTAIFELPFGHGKRFAGSASGVENAVVGGWSLSNIFLVESGPWLTPYYDAGGDPSGTGSGIIGRPQRPDRIGPWATTNQNASQWIMSSAFSCPGPPGVSQAVACLDGQTPGTDPAPIGRFGNSGTAFIEGPGSVNWNLGLQKRFNLTERVKMQVEISFTNVLNHVNLGDPQMDLTSPGFGTITAARGLSNGQSDFQGSRAGQFGARIEF
jgi:hypothetical protein